MQSDPIHGWQPHRLSVCQVSRLTLQRRVPIQASPARGNSSLHSRAPRMMRIRHAVLALVVASLCLSSALAAAQGMKLPSSYNATAVRERFGALPSESWQCEICKYVINTLIGDDACDGPAGTCLLRLREKCTMRLPPATMAFRPAPPSNDSFSQRSCAMRSLRTLLCF